METCQTFLRIMYIDRSPFKMNQDKNMKKRLSADWLVILPAVLTAVVVHILCIQNFGIFRDELYYLACADHPAFGYVDQPPLSIWLLKLITLVFGSSVAAIRILPVLASGAWIYMTGKLAREFGGGRFAMLLASVAALVTLGNMVIFHFYSMNFLDMIFWQILFFILIRLLKTQDTRYWLWFGLTAGLASLNKISILFFGFGLVAGLLMTKNRMHLKSGHFWAGLGIAFVIFLPYIVWNALHDWAMLTFIHNAKTCKMASVSPAGFLIGQILYNNPVNVLIWITGLIFLLFYRAAEKFRLFGWLFLAIYILFTIQGAKDYYLAAAYPVLFAGGAVLWEKWLRRKAGPVIRPLLIIFLILPAVFLAPVTLPILPVDQTIRHIQKIGIQSQAGENHDMGILPQHFADMHGWPEMAAVFAEVYNQLSEEERRGCVIYLRNYGEAGAIDYYGPRYGLPKASCAHNNYWLWGPPEWDGRLAIIYGWNDDVQANLNDLNNRFESVVHAATFSHPYCMPYENNRPIFICRNARFSFEEIWLHEKHFI